MAAGFLHEAESAILVAVLAVVNIGHGTSRVLGVGGPVAEVGDHIGVRQRFDMTVNELDIDQASVARLDVSQSLSGRRSRGNASGAVGCRVVAVLSITQVLPIVQLICALSGHERLISDL